MKVAIVYDRVNKWGGAERVLLALHKIWPEAPLFTSVYDHSLAPWAKIFKVNTSFIQSSALPKNAHEYYPFLMGLAFETFKFDEYDVVISVTSEFAKAIITKPNTLHVCLCLNPTGYLWSAQDNYFSDKNIFFKFISRPIINFLRWYDQIASHRPDHYVAISKVVAERVKKYYSQNSVVIYPPVSPLIEGSIKGKLSQQYSAKNYYLIVARLVPNKRLDIAVSAFNELGDELIVVGVGKQLEYLQSKARKNIHFVGNLTDEQLCDYYINAKALVVPGEEDFGIVMVEAQSLGVPVIAYARGGALEIITENKTGWFFQEQNAKELMSVIVKTRNLRVNQLECIENSKRFSAEVFEREFKRYIEKLNDEKRR